MIISSLELFTHKLAEGTVSNLAFNGARGSAPRLASLYSIGVVSAYASPTTATALYASSYAEDIANVNYPFDVHSTASGPYSILGARVNPATAGFSQGCYIVVDRLSHQGGLNATGTGAQTTNLPTAALPRFTNGIGVMMAIEIYTQIGTTTTTVTVSYTNQDGTSGRTSPAIQIGGTGYREAGRILIPSLQAGDTGVRSVESIQLAGNTGTAGSIGITLFRPLFLIPINNTDGPHICDMISGNFLGYAGDLDRQTNLSLMASEGNSTTTTFAGVLIMAYEEQ